MADKKARILVVDNKEDSLRSTEGMLLSLGFQVVTAHNSKEALEKVTQNPTNVVLLDDALISGTNGFEMVRKLKRNAVSAVVPIVLMISQANLEDRQKALAVGVDDFLNKPIDKSELQARLNCLLKVNAYNVRMLDLSREVEAEVAKRTESLQKALEKIKIASLDTVYRLSRAAEYKDEDTGAHVQRMSHYSSAIARAAGYDDEFVENILWAAPMHDIGKIGIPDRILQKPGKLDTDEWAIMKQHTTIGVEILKDASADFIKLAGIIAYNHHEKWDGSGYPQELKGTDIPIAGRIVALADVFDALTSDRVYRPAVPLEKALAIIKEGQGSHFDPALVDTFVSIKDEIVRELNWWKFLTIDASSSESGLSDLFKD
ncbi:MAG: HD domain-containing phosphohydrolase [Chloroflexota bacterium]